VSHVAGLVSVIIPVYNRPRGLREAVQSALQQDYRPLEILIVDDGSTDGTGAVANELAHANREILRVLRQDNAGPGVAREHGRREARGEFLQYLDSDDVLLPGKLARQVEALRSHPEADIAYGWTRYRYADGSVHPTPWKGSGERHDTLFPSILVQRWWDTPNPLYRTAICDRAGAWLGLWNEEDWEYDVRVGAAGAVLARVEHYVCEVRDHAEDRLCRGGLQRHRMRDRAVAHEAMWRSATATELPRDRPESAEFARRLFLLSRQCGSVGLTEEAERLFALAREASTERKKHGLDFRLYQSAAHVLGWAWTGRIACWSDRLRSNDSRA
jgi:glycosyltransferase involved in cell wall biosynthesis